MPAQNQSLESRAEFHGWGPVNQDPRLEKGCSQPSLPHRLMRKKWVNACSGQTTDHDHYNLWLQRNSSSPGNPCWETNWPLGILKHNHFLGIFLELHTILKLKSCLKNFPPGRTWDLGEREPNTSLSWEGELDRNNSAKYISLQHIFFLFCKLVSKHEISTKHNIPPQKLKVIRCVFRQHEQRQQFSTGKNILSAKWASL